MAAQDFEPDDELNEDLARTTDHLIERSRRLLDELDGELARIRRRNDLRDRRSA